MKNWWYRVRHPMWWFDLLPPDEQAQIKAKWAEDGWRDRWERTD